MDSKPELVYYVAFLVTEKIIKVWSPLWNYHAPMYFQVLAKWRVSEPFNFTKTHKFKQLNHWCECKNIFLSCFKLPSPLKVIRIIALLVWTLGSMCIFTIWMKKKVTINSIEFEFWGIFGIKPTTKHLF